MTLAAALVLATVYFTAPRYQPDSRSCDSRQIAALGSEDTLIATLRPLGQSFVLASHRVAPGARDSFTVNPKLRTVCLKLTDRAGNEQPCSTCVTLPAFKPVATPLPRRIWNWIMGLFR